MILTDSNIFSDSVIGMILNFKMSINKCGNIKLAIDVRTLHVYH